jgi:hypothetical protein
METQNSIQRISQVLHDDASFIREWAGSETVSAQQVAEYLIANNPNGHEWLFEGCTDEDIIEICVENDLSL